MFKGRTAAVLSLILCLAFFSTLMRGRIPTLAVSGSVMGRRPTVILDAGHGGGYEVVMTRDSDVSTDDVETDKIAARKKSDLKNRLKLMKDYPDAVFVSIHLNKFTTSAAAGSQVFYGAGREESKKLGEDIQKAIVRLLQPENTRVNKKATSSTYILYNATLPAVLVECGFLSNTAELKRLKTEEYQNKMAFGIFCGIMDYYKIAEEG